jgi:hypothetical protein
LRVPACTEDERPDGGWPHRVDGLPEHVTSVVVAADALPAILRSLSMVSGL